MIAINIKILNHQTIKITLSEKDMKKHNISYEKMNSNDKTTQQLLSKILKKIKDTVSIDIEKNKVLIEAFPIENKGCILYLNMVKEEKSNNKNKQNNTNPLIAKFQTIKELRNFCKNIISKFESKILKSELYSLNNEFILTVYFSDEIEEKKLTAIFTEFGKIIGKGELKNRIVGEHCNSILKSNAIDEIIKLK